MSGPVDCVWSSGSVEDGRWLELWLLELVEPEELPRELVQGEICELVDSHGVAKLFREVGVVVVDEIKAATHQVRCRLRSEEIWGKGGEACWVGVVSLVLEDGELVGALFSGVRFAVLLGEALEHELILGVGELCGS